jgi:hypothetical protein
MHPIFYVMEISDVYLYIYENILFRVAHIPNVTNFTSFYGNVDELRATFLI